MYIISVSKRIERKSRHSNAFDSVLVTDRQLTLAACLRRCMSGWATCLPLAAVVAAARSRSAAATSRAACSSSTCDSGLPAPSDMAPSFTTSHSCTATTTSVTITRARNPSAPSTDFHSPIVLTELCAAVASCSCVPAAPPTSVLVSSTSVFAVFRMFSRWSENVSFSLSDWRVPGSGSTN